MLTRAMAVIAAMVVAVVVLSVGIGLTTPDGVTKEAANAAPATSVATPTAPPSAPTAPPSAPVPTADQAPVAVAGIWPGRPAKVKVEGKDVNWCPAVKVDASADARRAFGKDGVAAAACAAVSFVFDHRYSRLTVPRTTYRIADFDTVVSSLTPATANSYYRPRIAEFVRNPTSPHTARCLGLVLLRSAGSGYSFYGPDDSTKGYTDRAVWINPQWSKVSITVDRTRAVPRAIATFTASAAIPVFNTSKSQDAMVTVPTAATYVLRHQKGAWAIAGWSIQDRPSSPASLAVR